MTGEPVNPLPPKPQELLTTTLEGAAHKPPLGGQASEVDPVEGANRLRAMAFEAVSEGVVIADPTERIVMVNSAFEAITGYRPNEVVGRTMSFLQGGLTDPDASKAIREALRGSKAYSGEILNYRKDGSTFWNDLSISPLRDKQGHLTHYIGLMRDISERKQGAAAWEDGEMRYRHAAEAAGAYVMDMDTRYRYTFVSNQAERMFEYSTNEMIGRTPAQFMPPGEIERVNLWLQNHPQPDNTIRGLEHRIVTKSGAVRWMQVSRIPLRDSQGTITGHRGTGFDITDRKAAEATRAELQDQMRESQKMEAIGTLAGGIAHDFNNIIAAILGNVNLARQDVSPSSPALESLEQIHKAASRARDLVRQILAFSRREQTQYQCISLAPVAHDTVSMLRAMLPARVAIDVQCAKDVPRVLADASQIQQVIINLATNAMQAMAGRPGQITIRLERVQPEDMQMGKHLSLREMFQRHAEGLVCLSVADDGQGMDSALLGRIFEPFFTTKPVGEGTGLGLSVVHGIAQGHKGIITVDSQAGVGTRFDLYLPTATPASDEGANSNAQPLPQQTALVKRGITGKSPACSGQHIVYVDDDDALVLLVKRLLERRGHRVTAYQDQTAALQAAVEDPASIDLFLTDYNMPGLSGLELARQVRAIRPDLPIAIASGFIDETLSADAAGAGVQSLIFKATSVEEFCAAIEALLVPKG